MICTKCQHQNPAGEPSSPTLRRRRRLGRLGAGILLATVALSLPFNRPPAASEQPSRIYRIGILSPSSAPYPVWKPFRERLEELGYSEGHTVAFETRDAEGRLDRLSVSANIDGFELTSDHVR